MKILCLIFCAILYGCKEKETRPGTSHPYQIKGETITLTSNEWNALWKTDIANILLYAIDPNGNRINYEQGIDYDVCDNQIRRTSNSKILDFGNHKVVYQENGKFKWSPAPNMNPELTLTYQIYADYSYEQTSATIKPSTLMSHSLSEKLKSGKNIKIVASGTSVTYGVDTYDRYYNNSDIQTYPYLLAASLNAIYNINCQIVNLSINGGDVSQIMDVTTILAEKPDVVLIELGMNDHNGINPQVEHFRNAIDKAITQCKDKGIDVVLVGFFQQIEKWELEHPKNTIAYNNTIKELAALHNIYFADIYKFIKMQVDKNKLYKDYLGDYMHHPTSFGHQLYYLNVMPFFINKAYKEHQLLEILYSE